MRYQNLKIIAVILAAFIAACSVSNCYIKTQAAEATVATYTAEQVLIVLLALAGVTLSSDAIQNIWDGGHLDTDALLNNMRTYSQLLYTTTANMMSLGSYGITKLTASQSYMKLLKAWAANYFGNTVSDSATVGSVNGKIPVKSAGMTSYYVANGISSKNGQTYSLTTQFGLGFADYVVFASPADSTGIRWFICLPATLEGLQNYTSRRIEPVYNTPTVTENGTFIASMGLNSTRWGFATYNGVQFTVVAIQFRTNGFSNYYIDTLDNCYSMEAPANTDQAFNLYVKGLMESYYGGQISDTISSNVNGTVLAGVNNFAAVLQDVIGAGTKAIDDDGETKLEGDLVIGLPLAAGVAALLAALSTGEKTYSDFLFDLGLLALDGTETLEQINEQVNNLPIPSPSGVYSLDLTSLFPFCIPFDIVRILSAFNATPEAPHFSWTLPTGYQNGVVAYSDYTIDLSQFDTVAQVVRVFEYISFVLGLAIITRDLIRG